MGVNRSLIHARRYRGRPAGFTLIELLVTIAVLGILMAIAVTSYEFAMVKARRGAAEGCLLEAAQYMERYYTTNMTYVGATLPTCSSDVRPYYGNLAFSAGPAVRSYTLQATPVGRQATADAKCGRLTVNQAGQKAASGSAGVAGCW